MSGTAAPSAGPSKAVVESLSGSVGSVLALLATYPLKTIYTLQALSTGNSDGAPAVPTDDNKALAVLRFLQTYKLSTLYAGMGPNVVESALSSGVYFFFYSALKERAVAWQRARAARTGVISSGPGGGRGDNIGVLASLLVATGAGALNQLITMPASVVATRIQGYQSLPGAKAGGRPPTTWETISAVFREDGLGGFWKGLLPSMILLANPAVQYMLFEKIMAALKAWKARRLAAEARAAAAAAKEAELLLAEEHRETRAALARRRSADSDDALDGAAADAAAADAAAGKPAALLLAAADVKLSATEVFLAGALAKIGATVVTYPLIVVKARLQASSKASSGPGAVARPVSTWSVISETARNEGMGGFFKGLRAKILQTALNAALMLMLKEQLHDVTRAALSLPLPRLPAPPPPAPRLSPQSPAAVAPAIKAPAAAG
ncbi:hypothetical protein HYH02_014986 [Chlamydomonas schloesseri]|uniref:Mitochondrial carrier protein n=1 Tax=Chlamydomonas schloesseri TaxID=2026947 RepID=A0A835SIL8_9CHLO|nr:hypothetical protein HYH02_014986 [Chlamydomonas schloesseri]|eukprot:KAG2425612.1 hypothetical protein HYH02_014986 [Chlamydomonas schloesseri]